MTNLVPVASFDDVPQVEVSTALLGGPGGPMNAQAQALMNRTEYLRLDKYDMRHFYVAGETTVNAMINRAIDANNRVHIPEGVWPGTAEEKIKNRTGTRITGDGLGRSILNILIGTGGSIAELFAYAKGSVIGREFDPFGTNPYVTDVYMADFAVVLNHPNSSITTTKIQIGLDMRNITGSTIERVHVGNIAPVGGLLVKTYSKPFAVQGYAVAFGSKPGSDPSYAGGEKNLLLNSKIYGAYKCVIQDDVALCGSSASYGTTVRDCDIQTGHWLIGQMGKYGAGNSHMDNILQDIQKQSGDSSPSYVMYYDGYNNEASAKYIEGGSNVDYQVYLDTGAKNNVIRMKMGGSTSGAGAITDGSNANSHNLITHFGKDGKGPLVEMYNKALKSPWVKFHWDGAAVVIDAGQGATVTRTGVGDYTITWDMPMSSADYVPSIVLDTNASGHGGTVDVGSSTASNIRIYTYAQNGATSTLIDPRHVWVRVSQ